MALTSQRQRISVFSSPKVEDYIFFEVVDGQRVGQEIPQYKTPHPDTRKWPNHFLVLVSQADDEGQVFHYYYAAERANQDDYNWAHTTADLGGSRYDTVTRSYLTLRSDFDDASPTIVSAMPITDEDPFTEEDGYILLERMQSRIGEAGRSGGGSKELDSAFILEQHIYIKRVPLVSVSYDETFGNTIRTEELIIHKDEIVADGKTMAELVDLPAHEYWELGDDGYVRTASAASSGWFVIRNKQLINIPNYPEDAVVRSFHTTENFMWPAVLGQLRSDVYPKKRGGASYVTTGINSKEVYRGPCDALVEVFWSSTPFTDIAPDPPMLPLSIDVTSPITNIHHGPTLHKANSIWFTTGTEHPIYKWVTSIFPVPRTNYQDWPDTILASDDQRPFRGGYLRQKTTIYAPQLAEED